MATIGHGEPPWTAHALILTLNQAAPLGGRQPARRGGTRAGVCDVSHKAVEGRRPNVIQERQKLRVQALVRPQMLRVAAPIERAGRVGIERGLINRHVVSVPLVAGDVKRRNRTQTPSGTEPQAGKKPGWWPRTDSGCCGICLSSQPK